MTAEPKSGSLEMEKVKAWGRESAAAENTERERHRKMDEEFVRKHIVDVVGTAAEGGFRDEIV